MAKKKLSKGDIVGTIAVYETAIGENSKENCLAFYLLGNIHLSSGRIGEAIKHYKNYFHHKCDKADSADVLSKEIRAHIRLGHLDKAKEILTENMNKFTTKAFDELSTELTTLQQLIDSLEQHIQNKQWKQALEVNEKLRRDLTHSNRLLKYKFECFEALNDINGLVAALKVYIVMNPDDIEAMLKLSQSFFNQCSFDDSLHYVRACLKSDQGNPSCMKHMRNVKSIKRVVDNLNGNLNQKNFKKVVKDVPNLNKIYKDQPTGKMECLYLRSLYLECVARSHLKQTPSDTVKLCSTALEKADGVIKMKAELLLSRGLSYINLDQLDEAKKDIEDSISLDSTKEAEEAKQNVDRLIKNRNRRDYYKILEIPRNANEKQITSAYRKKALAYHPDKAKNDEERELFEKKFMDINSAREVLLDEEKRALFDKGVDPLDAEDQQQHQRSHYGHPFSGGGQSFFHADHGFFDGGHFRFHF